MNKKIKEYITVEEAYNELVKPLTKYAERRVYSIDRALEAVQDAFVKAVEYKQKKPEAKISRYVLYRQTARACKKINQQAKELSWSEEQITQNEGEQYEKQRGQARPGPKEY